jgi:caa(3)-type oxidase subunit IV
MSDDHHDISKHVRGYLIIGGVLILGTILTVLASYVDLGNHALNIGLGLLIATVKASLVALYFMHLISERTLIYIVMGFTAFFFVGLMFLTLGAYADFPPLTATK